MTVSGVGRTGESRWMMIDGWIVADRHRCLSGCPSGRPNGRPSGVGCQRFGLVGKEIMLLGMRTEAGIRLEVDKHAGEP